MNELKSFFVKGSFTGISCGKGWHPLIKETHKAILKVDPEYNILQIKEKFGGLRYYIRGTYEAQIIAGEAGIKAEKICEVCGSPGTLREGRWWKTLCEEHK